MRKRLSVSMACILVVSSAFSCKPSPTAELSVQEKQSLSSPVPNHTPAVSPESMVTFVPSKPPLSLQGRIYIGEYHEGNYLVVNMSDYRVERLRMLGSCAVMNNGKEAVCHRETRLMFYDLEARELRKLPWSDVSSWRLTPDQRILYYTTSGSGSIEKMFAYKIGVETHPHLLTHVDMAEWLVVPALSSGGEYLAGARYLDGKYRLILIDYRKGVLKEIATPFWATWNLAWSPYGQVLVYGLTEEEPVDVGFCTTYVEVYDVATGEISRLAQAPPGSCYDDFEAHFSNIWSPDASRVALVQQNRLCLVRIGNGVPECHRIADEDSRIGRAAWSPDSQFVAYVLIDRSGREQRLGVFSLADSHSFVLPVEITLPLYTVFVWVP